MTPRRLPPRAPAQELKLMISAAAIAATVCGWAALTTQPPPVSEVSAPPAWLLDQPPIPTLVPITGLAPAADPRSVNAPARALREVSAPPAAARPAPVTFTRSSR